MLNKNEVKKMIKNIDKKELAEEIVEVALDFRGIDGVVYAELDTETGEVNVNFRADFELKPIEEKGLWIAQFTTHNMEEIPEDLPDEIAEAEDDVAAYYRTYAEDLMNLGIIEFIDIDNIDL